MTVKIHCQVVDDVLVAGFEGQIDINSQQQITDAQELSAASSNTVFDLTQTSYIDSAGLGGLVKIARTIKSKGKNVVVVTSNPIVARILKITSLDRMMPIAGNTETGIQLAKSA